jgi:hypothetical protein
MCDFNKPSFTVSSDEGEVKVVLFHQEEHQLYGLVLLEDGLSVRQFEGKISNVKTEFLFLPSAYPLDDPNQVCSLYEFNGEVWKQGAVTQGKFMRSPEKNTPSNKKVCRLTTHINNLIPYAE